MAYTRAGTPIRFGLYPGSADLIGWKTMKVSDLVARGVEEVAVFLSIEVKRPGENLEASQGVWHEAVKRGGGLSPSPARSVEDVTRALA